MARALRHGAEQHPRDRRHREMARTAVRPDPPVPTTTVGQMLREGFLQMTSTSPDSQPTVRRPSRSLGVPCAPSLLPAGPPPASGPPNAAVHRGGSGSHRPPSAATACYAASSLRTKRRAGTSRSGPCTRSRGAWTIPHPRPAHCANGPGQSGRESPRVGSSPGSNQIHAASSRITPVIGHHGDNYGDNRPNCQDRR